MDLEIKKLFVGIDPSLSGTGVIVIDNDANILDQKLISTHCDKRDFYNIEHRIVHIVKELEFLIPYKPVLKFVLIEGISYGSKGDGAAQLAALNYYIRIFLLQNEILYGEATPSKLKKFVTGVGNCKKNLMLKEVFKKWGVDFNDDNLADAYSLSRLAKNDYHIFKGKLNGQSKN
jgi:crossover junction endodeoxyribonuclease RuvC